MWSMTFDSHTGCSKRTKCGDYKMKHFGGKFQDYVVICETSVKRPLLIRKRFPLKSEYECELSTLYKATMVTTIHTHVHTPTAETTTQGDRQLVGSSQCEVTCSGTPQHSARRSRGSG